MGGEQGLVGQQEQCLLWHSPIQYPLLNQFGGGLRGKISQGYP
jgi:hypothetical protein